jgi:hypothetical protein
MGIASASDRISNGRQTMTQAEAAWPEMRFAAIGEAWRLYRRHWTVWSLTALVAMICVLVGQGVAALASTAAGAGMFGGLLGFGYPGVPMIQGLLGMAVAGFFLGGMIRMAVNQVRGRSPRLEDLFSVTDVWFDLCVGSILVGIPLMIGWSLFVLPGMVVAGMTMFVSPLIVDGRLPATGAIIQSFDAQKSQWLLATIVHLGIAIVAGLGIFLLGIGIVLTAPLYALSIAVLYRDLFLDPTAASWEKPHDPFRDL